MSIQGTLEQLFAVCLLSAAVEAVAGDGASGVRAICGLAIVVNVLRLALGILG